MSAILAGMLVNTLMKTHSDGSHPLNGEVFVFGSNLAGVHGAGAAKAAMRDIHWDYLHLMKKRNQYKGYGFPNEKKELAEHIFFCTPDDKIKPKKKDYKQGDKQPVPAEKPFDYENSI